MSKEIAALGLIDSENKATALRDSLHRTKAIVAATSLPKKSKADFKTKIEAIATEARAGRAPSQTQRDAIVQQLEEMRDVIVDDISDGAEGFVDTGVLNSLVSAFDEVIAVLEDAEPDEPLGESEIAMLQGRLDSVHQYNDELERAIRDDPAAAAELPSEMRNARRRKLSELAVSAQDAVEELQLPSDRVRDQTAEMLRLLVKELEAAARSQKAEKTAPAAKPKDDEKKLARISDAIAKLDDEAKKTDVGNSRVWEKLKDLLGRLDGAEGPEKQKVYMQGLEKAKDLLAANTTLPSSQKRELLQNLRELARAAAAGEAVTADEKEALVGGLRLIEEQCAEDASLAGDDDSEEDENAASCAEKVKRVCVALEQVGTGEKLSPGVAKELVDVLSDARAYADASADAEGNELSDQRMEKRQTLLSTLSACGKAASVFIAKVLHVASQSCWKALFSTRSYTFENGQFK
jgi:hypothetical protein